MKPCGFWRRRSRLATLLLVFFKKIPTLDNLHSDPRWKALMRRIDLPIGILRFPYLPEDP